MKVAQGLTEIDTDTIHITIGPSQVILHCHQTTQSRHDMITVKWLLHNKDWMTVAGQLHDQRRMQSWNDWVNFTRSNGRRFMFNGELQQQPRWRVTFHLPAASGVLSSSKIQIFDCFTKHCDAHRTSPTIVWHDLRFLEPNCTQRSVWNSLALSSSSKPSFKDTELRGVAPRLVGLTDC